MNASASDAWSKFCQEMDVPLTSEPGKKPDQDFLDVLQHFKHLWKEDGPTIWIYGDTVFSHRMMNELCASRPNDIFFAARFSPSEALARWRAEIFGWNMHPRFHDELESFLRVRKCSPYHKATDVWSLFHYLMDRRDGNERDASFIDAGEDDYTLDLDYEGDVTDLPVLEMLAMDDDKGLRKR